MKGKIKLTPLERPKKGRLALLKTDKKEPYLIVGFNSKKGAVVIEKAISTNFGSFRVIRYKTIEVKLSQLQNLVVENVSRKTPIQAFANYKPTTLNIIHSMAEFELIRSQWKRAIKMMNDKKHEFIQFTVVTVGNEKMAFIESFWKGK